MSGEDDLHSQQTAKGLVPDALRELCSDEDPVMGDTVPAQIVPVPSPGAPRASMPPPLPPPFPSRPSLTPPLTPSAQDAAPPRASMPPPAPPRASMPPPGRVSAPPPARPSVPPPLPARASSGNMQAAPPVPSSNAEPTAKERRDSSHEPAAKDRRSSSHEPTAKDRRRYVAPSMPELELPSTQVAAASNPATASQGPAAPSSPVSPSKGADSVPSVNMYLRQMLEGPSLELDVVPSSDAAPLSTQPYRPAVRGIRCGMEPAAAPKDETAWAQDVERLGNFGPVPNVWWQWGLYGLHVHRRLRTLKSERTALEASCKQAYEQYEKAVVQLGQQVLEMEGPPPSSAAPISLQPVSNRPKADAPVGIRDQGPPPAVRFAIEAAFRALNFPKKIPTNHPLRLEVDLRQDEMQKLRALMDRYDAAMGAYDHRIAQSGLRVYASAFAVFFLVAVVPMLVRLAIREEWLPDALAR